MTEMLDIVPAEYFVHRHVRGKWACRCRQIPVQEPVAPENFGKGLPAAGLIAHTMVSRFIDPIPYYRQATINARSQVRTPRSSLASWSGAGGASLQPVFEVHRDFVLDCAVVHAEEKLDDAYLGGERPGVGGRGSHNKVPIVAAVSTEDAGHPMRIKLSPIARFTTKAITEWARIHLVPGCDARSDGLNCFAGGRGHPQAA